VDKVLAEVPRLVRQEGAVSVLLSIDPGVRGCGCALFRDGKLVAAAYVKNSAKKGNSPFECVGMAIEVKSWTSIYVDSSREALDRLVLEFPQTYGGRAAKGDANDLFPLAAIDGAIVALFPRADVTSYFPREWKSNMDPDALIARVKGRLTPEEHVRVELPAPSLQHNVWDGVGVGLCFLGRLAPKKIFARS
jgi:hypothetical protein